MARDAIFAVRKRRIWEGAKSATAPTVGFICRLPRPWAQEQGPYQRFRGEATSSRTAKQTQSNKRLQDMTYRRLSWQDACDRDWGLYRGPCYDTIPDKGGRHN